MEEMNWYALKVFYNKVFEMEDRLIGMGFETYLAVALVPLKREDHLAAARKIAALPEGGRPDSRLIKQGPVIFQRVPMVNSLIFVRADEAGIKRISEMLKGPLEESSPRGFVYRTSDWKSYSKIPDKQMMMFRLITSSGDTGLQFFSPEDISRFRQGQKVRVIEGPLKGAEGYIKRIRKNRRLLVAMEGIVAVATSYIPPQFLEKVED
ncbi:MAG: transcriptional regulator [Bacteroidales bacterium]|nr:transcriptional regulator [Bacteroidales bacterium]